MLADEASLDSIYCKRLYKKRGEKMWNHISWVHIVLLAWEIWKDGRTELNSEGSLSQVFGQKYGGKLIYLAIQAFETNLSRWPNCVITVRWCFLFTITSLRINLAVPNWFEKKKKRAPSSTAAGADWASFSWHMATGSTSDTSSRLVASISVQTFSQKSTR